MQLCSETWLICSVSLSPCARGLRLCVLGRRLPRRVARRRAARALCAGGGGPGPKTPRLPAARVSSRNQAILNGEGRFVPGLQGCSSGREPAPQGPSQSAKSSKSYYCSDTTKKACTLSQIHGHRALSQDISSTVGMRTGSRQRRSMSCGCGSL